MGRAGAALLLGVAPLHPDVEAQRYLNQVMQQGFQLSRDRATEIVQGLKEVQR